MSSKRLPSLLTLSLYFNILLISSFTNPNKLYSRAEKTEDANNNIKGMFVFGSSLVDNGNNNFLQNLAKADYLPYGIDFPLGPSGRFTNGKNVIDLFGDRLNLPAFIPAFTDPSTNGNRTVLGVNYASGGSGILDETGSIAGEVMSLNEQIKKFEEVTLPEFERQVESSSTESLPKYLFVVGSGGNDYTLNYFLTKSQGNISIQDFTANLTTTLSYQLKVNLHAFPLLFHSDESLLPGGEGGNGILCKRGGSTCGNRSMHVYFDGLHPTEAVNVVLTTKAFDSNFKNEVYPISVRELAQIFFSILFH